MPAVSPGTAATPDDRVGPSRETARPLVSVVVPALDEAQSLPELARRVAQALAGEDATLELIVVDDGSTDRTAAVVRELHAADPRVKLVSLSRNFGHQAALTAGLDASRGDVVVTMDGDLQHPPELLPEMLTAWRRGYDVVHTVRRDTRDAGPLKRVTSAAFYWVFRRLSGVDLPAGAADFRLLDRRIVAALGRMRERSRFLRGLSTWVGYASTCVPFSAGARSAGHTKYGPLRMLRLALDAVASFSALPLYLAVWVGAALSALTFLYGLYALYVKLVSHTALPGWSSAILLTAGIGGIQLLVLGVLGFYIAKLYEEIKDRPIYLVRETVGLESPGESEGH